MTTPKFKLRPDISSHFTGIEILEGDYEGCVYHYGKTQLIEEDDCMRVKFDYTLVENPNRKLEDQNFINCMGDILVEILDNQLEEDGSLIPVVSNDEVSYIGNYREDNPI
tara:strand:- start:9570 stop:9899 length:330 start_codon:yes stop_codon:yes gene_type:complete